MNEGGWRVPGHIENMDTFENINNCQREGRLLNMGMMGLTVNVTVPSTVEEEGKQTAVSIDYQAKLCFE